MLFVFSSTEYPFRLFLLLFVSSNLFCGIHGSKNEQEILASKLVVLNHEFCQSCPERVLSLEDVDTYSELKYDPRASLPSSFTVCVSVLVTTNNLSPSLFTLLGNDKQPWFAAKISQKVSFLGRKFFYTVSNQYVKIDTMWMFPNQWVRSCLALNTLSGSVQWVARGELVDNSTFSEIKDNVLTDLGGKVILGSFYQTLSSKAKWHKSSNKVTKLEIFSSALSVEKMIAYTKGGGCGDDGDYLSWDEMQWNLYGEAKVEHIEAKETCTMQPFYFYNSTFDMKSCMHFCEKLGGSRVPSATSLLQFETMRESGGISTTSKF